LEELRWRARGERHGPVSAGLVAIDNALEGMDRASAARLPGVDRQSGQPRLRAGFSPGSSKNEPPEQLAVLATDPQNGSTRQQTPRDIDKSIHRARSCDCSGMPMS
jgi:hypothetical protein